MGTWSLDRLTTHSSPLDGLNFGTNYHAIFHLRYTPSAFGQFKETPRLDWHETIFMKDHQSGEHWGFDTNMYEHKPYSPTLKVWPRRYLEAYRYVAGIEPYVDKGKVELKTNAGARVTPQQLGGPVPDGATQADLVRTYLKRNGGQLIIEIHDIPSMNIPRAGQHHKERLLLFNIGVEGLPLRSKAEQYLSMDVHVGVTPNNLQREFIGYGWRRGLVSFTTTGLRMVPPPIWVAAPAPPAFYDGECW